MNESRPADPEPETEAEIIPFDPVPAARARHDGWTPARQQSFIGSLAALGLVAPAARAAGMSAKSAYALRRRTGAESFVAAWEQALEIGRAAAFDNALERALKGTVTPIFYESRKIGERVRYNDRLTIAVLTGRAPERPARHARPDAAQVPEKG